MATTTTKTKKVIPPAPPAAGELPLHIDRKRQIRLGAGIFFLLAGVFICYSIISYYFTWNEDQDKFFTAGNHSIWYLLWSNDLEVSNKSGHLGATIGHIFVYKGAGIASIAIGLGVAAMGLNLLYEKKPVTLLRYMRWISILLLLLAPTLTYLFPNSSFRIGGALGNRIIDVLEIQLGTSGTGMLLLAVISFFTFVIFALDLGPFVRKLSERARVLAEAMRPDAEPEMPQEPAAPVTPATAAPVMPVAAAEVPAPAATPPAKTAAGNKLKGSNSIPLIIENPVVEQPWDMGIVQKNVLAEAPAEDEEEYDEEEEDFDHFEDEEKPVAEEEEYEEEVEDDEEDEEPEEPPFSFEVKQPERPTIKHGAHISIASNEPYAPELDLPDYKFPTLSLLEDRSHDVVSLNKAELERNKDQIVDTLGSFGIEIQNITATVGPTVTLYEIVPAKGVRISKIKNLEDDIALSLAALGIRIIAPIPGKGTIGIEVPNAQKQIVSMMELLSSEKFVNNKMSLPIALGKKIDNENYIVDLATMPHLLMAGATGQGKSVGINAILVSLLYKKHPSQLKFVMVDPKKVELSIYRVIEKHFLAKLPNEEEPIITDIKKVIYTLKALCDEMDDRYGLLKDAGARNIKEYNDKFIARRLNPENGHKYLPFIVLVIDEFADLIMTAGKEVEMPIARLAQLSRAVGIHLIIATQRPSVNVITGTIKANFPARIAFKVSAKVDSRTILDTGGAEQLVGRGDMLISHGSELLRLQCAFVDTPEVENIVNFIGSQRGYPKAHALPEPEMDDDDSGGKNVDLKNRDKLFEECARLVVLKQNGSTSNLQRQFNLGYNRAGRIMDQLEAAQIVGPAAGSKPRDVYIHTEQELEEFLGTLG